MQSALFVLSLQTGRNAGPAPDKNFLSLAAETCLTLEGLYPGCRAMVLTNDEKILSDMNGRNAEALFSPSSPDRDAPTPLPISLARDESLVRTALELGLERIITLDFTTFAPDISDIPAAIREYKDSKAPALFSISSSRDHPCQLKSYFNISSVGMLHVVERERPEHLKGLLDSKAMTLTKPFLFDWPSAGIDNGQAGEVFDRTYERQAVVYLETSMPPTDDNQQPLFIHENSKEARLLFHRNPDSERNIEAVAFDHALKQELAIERDRNGKLWFKTGNEPGQGNLILRICGLMGKVNSAMKLDIPFIENRAPLPQKISLNEVRTCTYVLLRESVNQIYDLAEPYALDNGMWFFDKLTKKNINIATGREISGRQDFPDVFEIDGHISIFKTRDAHRLEEILQSGQGYGYQPSRTPAIAPGAPGYLRIDTPSEKTLDKGRAIA